MPAVSQYTEYFIADFFGIGCFRLRLQTENHISQQGSRGPTHSPPASPTWKDVSVFGTASYSLPRTSRVPKVKRHVCPWNNLVFSSLSRIPDVKRVKTCLPLEQPRILLLLLVPHASPTWKDVFALGTASYSLPHTSRVNSSFVRYKYPRLGCFMRRIFYIY